MEINGSVDAVELMEESFRLDGADSNGHHKDEDDTGRPEYGTMVSKIALVIAKALESSIRELEDHVFIETRRRGAAVETRLNTVANDVADLSRFIEEQRSVSGALHEKMQHFAVFEGEMHETCGRHTQELETLRTDVREFSRAFSQRLDASAAALEEHDARHTRAREALQTEVRSSFQPVWERIDSLCRDIDAQKDDIAVTRNTLNAICSRIDACFERLDRHAGAVRALHGASREREIEFEHIVEGLVRLKASPRPDLVDGL